MSNSSLFVIFIVEENCKSSYVGDLRVIKN